MDAGKEPLRLTIPEILWRALDSLQTIADCKFFHLGIPMRYFVPYDRRIFFFNIFGNISHGHTQSIRPMFGNGCSTLAYISTELANTKLEDNTSHDSVTGMV